MTNRSEMLPSHLEGFIEFIKSKGWELAPFEHYYEVLRAVKDDETEKNNEAFYKDYQGENHA